MMAVYKPVGGDDKQRESAAVEMSRVQRLATAESLRAHQGEDDVLSVMAADLIDRAEVQREGTVAWRRWALVLFTVALAVVCAFVVRGVQVSAGTLPGSKEELEASAEEPQVQQEQTSAQQAQAAATADQDAKTTESPADEAATATTAVAVDNAYLSTTTAAAKGSTLPADMTTTDPDSSIVPGAEMNMTISWSHMCTGTDFSPSAWLRAEVQADPATFPASDQPAAESTWVHDPLILGQSGTVAVFVQFSKVGSTTMRAALHRPLDLCFFHKNRDGRIRLQTRPNRNGAQEITTAQQLAASVVADMAGSGKHALQGIARTNTRTDTCALALTLAQHNATGTFGTCEVLHFGSPQQLPGPQCVYFTLLREPVSRVVSAFNYFCRACSESGRYMPSAVNCCRGYTTGLLHNSGFDVNLCLDRICLQRCSLCLPRYCQNEALPMSSECPNAMLADFAREQGNVYTKEFSMAYACADCPSPQLHLPADGGDLEAPQSCRTYPEVCGTIPAATASLLAKAKANIVSAGVVPFILEELNSRHEKIETLLGLRPGALSEHHNANHRDESTIYHPTAGDIEELRQILQHDIKLYEFAQLRSAELLSQLQL